MIFSRIHISTQQKEDTCEVKVLADQVADKNNIGNHLAHNFVGISQGFTTSISHGSERVIKHIPVT